MALLVALLLIDAAQFLQEPINLFDGGLLLTLSRFPSLGLLPYRDMWTLYGPGTSLIGAVITPLFGRSMLAIGISQILVKTAVVLGMYALARRLVPWWLAAASAAALATYSAMPHHFTQAFALLLWGLWLVVTMDPLQPRAHRRAAMGATLIGLSFLGRYEFAAFAFVIVLAVWRHVRARLDPRRARFVLLSGLMPLAVFGLFLIAVVGLPKAWLNLVEYSARFYGKPFCRGIPTPWGRAVTELLAPLHARFWNGDGLMLWAGTFLAPIVGTAACVTALRRHRRSLIMAVAGALTLVLWMAMRPRAGGQPQPVWPPMLLGVAALLGSRPAGRKATRIVAIAVALTLAVPILGWLPSKVGAWTRWPPYDRIYGFADRADTLYDARVWGAVSRAVHSHAGPGEPIFVALHDNTGHFANAPIFYWHVDRPPGSRFIEFNPCLTDTARIQREIVAELQDTNVVITTTFYPQHPPPLGPPSTVLDEYLASTFTLVSEHPLPQSDPDAFVQRIGVLVRTSILAAGTR